MEGVDLNIEIKIIKNYKISLVNSSEVIIKDVQSALDFIATMNYNYDSFNIIMNKECFVNDFFDLSTKLAGDILQKIVNYNVKLAIVGDFSLYNSNALKDFIYECNTGKDIFFLENNKLAISKFENIL